MKYSHFTAIFTTILKPNEHVFDHLKSQKNKRTEKTRYIPVGRIDVSIDGKNWWVNRGKNRCHCYTLLQVQQREEDETEDSERRKKKETSKNSSNLMLRIETAIKDSRVFCSSTLLRDWEWNGFDNFLKLIRSSSHFCCSAMHSSLCSCCFGLLIVKGQNDIVSGMRI